VLIGPHQTASDLQISVVSSSRTKWEDESMPPAKGSAEWKGDVRSGTGTFIAGDSISGGYTYESRFEGGPGSNPKQLIATAHAACFSMALSNLLADSGTPPESINTDAKVTLRPVDGLPTITNIALVTVGKVPGLDEGTLLEQVITAKAGCPVSRGRQPDVCLFWWMRSSMEA
jgi:osmotically inducible protein OsmC